MRVCNCGSKTEAHPPTCSIFVDKRPDTFFAQPRDYFPGPTHASDYHASLIDLAHAHAIDFDDLHDLRTAFRKGYAQWKEDSPEIGHLPSQAAATQGALAAAKALKVDLSKSEAEVQRLKDDNARIIRNAQRLRCEAHKMDASNGWGCPVCVFELREAIRKHYYQKADDRCWMDDNDLYAAAGLPVRDARVGDRAAMLRNCERYIKMRCLEGGPWPTYAQLEADLLVAREDRRRAERRAQAESENRWNAERKLTAALAKIEEMERAGDALYVRVDNEVHAVNGIVAIELSQWMATKGRKIE